MKNVWKLVILLVLFTLPYWLQDPYYQHIVITTGLFIVGAMSLNLLLGYTGQLNLGHIAYFGIGAYVSALTSLGFDIPAFFGDGRIVVEAGSPFVGFLLAVVIAGLCGFIIGKLSFKIRGAYFVIVTISFAEVTRLVALNWVDLTQGPLALNNIPPLGYDLPFFGSGEFWAKTPNYYLVLVLGLVCYVIIRRIVQSRVGRAMIALRENEPLAVSAGINVTRYLNFAATVSAAMAGAAGSLYAHYIRIIDPDVFLFIYTVTMVIMVITGGKGTLIGPIIGGIIFGILPVGLREVVGPEIQWIVYGVAMVFIVMFLPQGIAPALLSKWEQRFGKRNDLQPARPKKEGDAQALPQRNTKTLKTTGADA